MQLSIAFHLCYLIKHLVVFMTVVHTYFYIVSNFGLDCWQSDHTIRCHDSEGHSMETSYLIQYKLKCCVITVSEDTAMPNLIRNLRLVLEVTNMQIRPRWGKRERSIYDSQEFTLAVLIFPAVLLTGMLFRICSRYEIHSARPFCFLYSNSRRTRHGINNHAGNRLHCGNPMMHHTYHHD